MQPSAPVPGRAPGKPSSKLGTILAVLGAALMGAGWLGRGGGEPVLEAIGANSARLPEWLEVLGTILVVIFAAASGAMIVAGAALLAIGGGILAWRALAAGRS